MTWQKNNKTCFVCNYSTKQTDPLCVNSGTDYKVCFTIISYKIKFDL